MSKTFKNTHTVHGKMTVREDGGCVSVSVNMDSPSDTIIHISPSDAPALALAILEAAGHGGSSESSCLMQAFDLIELHVKEQERITAEAKEQAELEAEALDFLNVSREAKRLGPLGNFDEHTKEAWLAVARKAREMRAEK